jgi:glycosyltransferase involved in cell wall biosynthesis
MILPYKIQVALEHEAELADYKSRAVKRITEHYTWDKVTDGYEELFRELVAGKYAWGGRQF